MGSVPPRRWVVIPAAGRGERMGYATPKQYLPLAGATVLEHALRPFLDHPHIAGILVVVARDDARWATLGCSSHPRVRSAVGGDTRMASVLSGLDALQAKAAPEDWVLVHDAARPCLRREDIDRLLETLRDDPVGGLLALPVSDTLRREAADGRSAETVERDRLWRAQTPQVFRYGALRAALQAAGRRGSTVTDEAAAMEAMGASVRLVEGSTRNLKITQGEDLSLAEAILGGSARGGSVAMTRVGIGFDVHAFGPGDHVMLGGVRVPHTRGVVAHSDGDVILHALCDALLGAAGLGDIGQHFPDTDPGWKGAASRVFLDHVLSLLERAGMRVSNVDITLLAEMPRLAPHRTAIVGALAEGLRLGTADVNVKATTLERLGFLGRGEGIAAQAVVTVTAA
jgi:2-C-methyl-D-erythritol 4-phosphate cytidylyltransferase/2-C-methyl-D-erythritol 2,4-cyclodiphosphate synthase